MKSDKIKELIRNAKNPTFLSHVDIDGFASQRLVEIHSSVFTILPNLINMQYGEEPVLPGGDLIVVTDLHFNKNDYEKYKKIYDEVIWIDHHISDDYPEYINNELIIIDTTMSATLLVANVLGYLNKNSDLYPILMNINAADIFDKSSIESFKTGREYTFVLNEIFSLLPEAERDNIGRNFIICLFAYDDIYDIMSFIIGHYVEENKTTLLEIRTKTLLEEMIKKSLFNTDGYIIVPTTNVSDISDDWFKMDENNKVMVGINHEKNTLSIRSVNGEANKLARFFNGGGHANASGASFDGKFAKDEIMYVLIEKFAEIEKTR